MRSHARSHEIPRNPAYIPTHIPRTSRVRSKSDSHASPPSSQEASTRVGRGRGASGLSLLVLRGLLLFSAHATHSTAPATYTRPAVPPSPHVPAALNETIEKGTYERHISRKWRLHLRLEFESGTCVSKYQRWYEDRTNTQTDAVADARRQSVRSPALSHSMSSRSQTCTRA